MALRRQHSRTPSTASGTLAASSERVAMIQGPADLSDEEFERQYVPQLNAALDQNCRYIVGCNSGAENLSVKYLLASGKLRDPSRITVYLNWNQQQKHGDESILRAYYQTIGVQVRSGFQTRSSRDEAMLMGSDFFIKAATTNTTTKNEARS